MYKKNILAIHLNSQIFRGFTAILFILTALIFSSRLVGYFEQAASGSLNPDIIFNVIFLRLPDFLALLIPFAFFLSLLLVISELYSSNGIYAYFSAGVSRLRLPSKACSKYPTRREEKMSPSKINKIALNPLKI